MASAKQSAAAKKRRRWLLEQYEGGVSQADLAEALGVCKSNISKAVSEARRDRISRKALENAGK